MEPSPSPLQQLFGPYFGEVIGFWAVALLVVSSAAVAAFSKSIVNAAYSLFFTLLGMAGFYVILGSDFLAVTQVVVYIGGILVLLMFGVLLTNRSIESLYSRERGIFLWAGLAAALLFFVVLAQIIYTGAWGPRDQGLIVPNTRGIGEGLLTTYVLPFEFSSITLLVCLIGAAYMARRREE